MKFDSLELANNLEKLKAVKLNNSIKNEDELSTIIDIKKNIRKYLNAKDFGGLQKYLNHQKNELRRTS
jgi:hypothetical protein